MNLDEFQKQRLEAYFGEHADDALKARREENKMTIKGAYAWLESRVKKCILNGEVKPDNRGMVVGDDAWCYAEMMFYFSKCEEGDIYKTEAELKREAAVAEAEKKSRHDKAVALWEKHTERVKKWEGKTSAEIAEMIKEEKLLKSKPWLAAMTPEQREAQLKAEAEREAAAEAKRKAEAERKAKKEAEAKVKAERKAEREAKVAAKAEAKRKAEEAQMLLF